MENDKYRLEMDLLSLRGAKVDNDTIVIPVSKNGIRLAKSKKDEGKMYATMSFNVIPRKTQGEHGEVAIIKPVMTIDEYNRWNAGIEVTIPIVGNVLIKKSTV